MHTFHIDDMSCGHCVASITRAVQALDADAQVQADMGRHLVSIHTARASAQALGAAITDAGYTPVLQAAVTAMPASPGPRRACGCAGGGGGCHA